MHPLKLFLLTKLCLLRSTSTHPNSLLNNLFIFAFMSWTVLDTVFKAVPCLTPFF